MNVNKSTNDMFIGRENTENISFAATSTRVFCLKIEWLDTQVKKLIFGLSFKTWYTAVVTRKLKLDL